MKDQYIFEIRRGDPDAPVSQMVVYQHGTDATDPKAFALAVQAVAQLILKLGSPEKAIEFMWKNKEAAQVKRQLMKG